MLHAYTFDWEGLYFAASNPNREKLSLESKESSAQTDQPKAQGHLLVLKYSEWQLVVFPSFTMLQFRYSFWKVNCFKWSDQRREQ